MVNVCLIGGLCQKWSSRQKTALCFGTPCLVPVPLHPIARPSFFATLCAALYDSGNNHVTSYSCLVRMGCAVHNDYAPETVTTDRSEIVAPREVLAHLFLCCFLVPNASIYNIQYCIYTRQLAKPLDSLVTLSWLKRGKDVSTLVHVLATKR